jgi:hypothetical protein
LFPILFLDFTLGSLESERAMSKEEDTAVISRHPRLFYSTTECLPVGGAGGTLAPVTHHASAAVMGGSLGNGGAHLLAHDFGLGGENLKHSNYHSAAATLATPIIIPVPSHDHFNGEAMGLSLPVDKNHSTTSVNKMRMVHFLAGGMGGTLGAIITCPLEVVKTRLQSTTYLSSYTVAARYVIPRHTTSTTTATTLGYPTMLSVPMHISKHIGHTFSVIRTIYQSEGCLALWKGLGPTIVGVAPSRAMNFGTYHWVKEHLAQFTYNKKENAWIHLISASCAGVISSTITNPLWMIKTRLQLQSDLKLSTGNYKNAFQCLTALVRHEGLRSLYCGLSASYLGIVETVIQFVLYEKMKHSKRERDVQRIMETLSLDYESACHKVDRRERSFSDWAYYLGIASVAKLSAAILAYPHEVDHMNLNDR